MPKVINVSSTHISLQDDRGRSIVVAPNETVGVAVSNTEKLNDAIAKGLIRVISEGKRSLPVVPAPIVRRPPTSHLIVPLFGLLPILPPFRQWYAR